MPVSLTYGLTEACSQVTTTPVAAIARAPASAPSAGPPLFCTRVRIAADGEILVRGPTVAPGRARRGRLAAHRRPRRARRRTAACASTGRKADTIVSGGENVAPAEVEAVLEAHPEVLEAAVLGRADAQLGRGGHGDRRRARRARRSTARSCARTAPRALAPYKVPKRVVARRPSRCRAPRSGKLLRRELR